VTLLLTNDDVEQVLDMRASLAVLEPAYRELTEGRAVLRRQSQTYLPGPLPQSSYCLKTVEGGSEALGVMAIRMTSDVLRGRQIGDTFRREKVAAAPGNRFLGLVLLFSLETGELLAILPDGIIQRLRVGVASALAADRLARADARVLGLICAGNQAEAQLRGLKCVRSLNLIRVFSPTAERREAFASRMRLELGLRVEAVSTAREAVNGADIVAAATNSGKPVLEGEWLRAGMHVGFIREFEVDDATLERADVLVVHTQQGDIDHYTPRSRDDLAQLQRGRGYPWHRYPELSDLVAGSAPGRTSSEQLTMFMNNFGIGIQFAALGAHAAQTARARGLGQEIPTDWFLESLQP
jgi:ornithine cyclodeaminase/alanine dehydrogenase-like protein (mu-crystallin family)